MVLSLKTWKSRPRPGLPRTLSLFTMQPFPAAAAHPAAVSSFHHAQACARPPAAHSRRYPHRRASDACACRHSGGSPRGAFYATHEATINRRRTPTPRIAGGKSVTAEAAAFAAPAAKAERAARLRVVASWLWSGALLVLLGFLVLYPVAMLLLGALTNTNPVVDGFGVFDLSLANFLTVLGNPNVHNALANSLIACAGGTALAVVIGLAFSWIVVRTNTPCRGFVAAACLIPLFVPPLVAGVAWSILGSPKSGLINTVMAWAGLDWRIDLYSMAGLILVFGMYYAPYIYLFTASALRNMDPSLEEAAGIAGVGPIRTLFPALSPVTPPDIGPARPLPRAVIRGLYGTPAGPAPPANIPVLPTYISTLTNGPPPLYSTAAAVAIVLMVVTGVLVLLQQ